MPRGYRYVILAALGWLILGAKAPERENSQSEKNQTEQSIADSLKSIDATLKKPAEREITNEPCDDGKERRYSDLCAQWKAADAASWSTFAAWVFGVLGALIGGATMVAAIRAAIYAKQAAEHTESGAREAQRGADAAEAALQHSRTVANIQFRPWLKMSVGISHIEFSEHNLSFTAEATLTNVGSSPARNVYVTPTLRNNTDVFMMELEVPEFDRRPESGKLGGTILPGETEVKRVIAQFSSDRWKVIERDDRRWINVKLIINTTYDWPDGQGQTAEVFLIIEQFRPENQMHMSIELGCYDVQLLISKYGPSLTV